MNILYFEQHGILELMKKGYKFTEEHKAKISLALKGKKKPWLKNGADIFCSCGKVFYRSKKTIVDSKRGKYCSRACHNKYHKPYKHFTDRIKHPIIDRNKWLQNISNTRVALGLAKGNKNPNWQGGKTKLNIVIRNHTNYKQWRKKVYERDSYTCVSCGIVGNGKNLNADHIRPLSIILRDNSIDTIDEAYNCKELWDISNGRTLCVACHKQTDSYGWRTMNNYIRKEQSR